MRALKPYIDEINAKYPKQEDQLKKQQETMALYSQYGAGPMGGCLPMLIQLPILYALFYLFQNAYVYVDAIGNNYVDIANAIINIPVATRMEVFQPFAQEFVDAYKNMAEKIKEIFVDNKLRIDNEALNRAVDALEGIRFNIAVIDVNISGNEVPIATTNIDIIPC